MATFKEGRATENCQTPLSACAGLSHDTLLVAGSQTQVEQEYYAGENFDSNGRSINACGDGLPSDLNPTCDRFLGDTPSCECLGKKRVEKVTVKVRATSAKCGKPQ